MRAKGVDVVACVSVNDAFVMNAWGKTVEAGAYNRSFLQRNLSRLPPETSPETVTHRHAQTSLKTSSCADKGTSLRS